MRTAILVSYSFGAARLGDLQDRAPAPRPATPVWAGLRFSTLDALTDVVCSADGLSGRFWYSNSGVRRERRDSAPRPRRPGREPNTGLTQYPALDRRRPHLLAEQLEGLAEFENELDDA